MTSATYRSRNRPTGHCPGRTSMARMTARCPTRTSPSGACNRPLRRTAGRTAPGCCASPATAPRCWPTPSPPGPRAAHSCCSGKTCQPRSSTRSPPASTPRCGADPVSAAPLVSVIMPMHNAERFIAQSIRSVLGQTVTDWELLIIDDASQDESRAVAEQAAAGDDRIRVLTNPGPSGAGPTRNVGIDAAAGRYIAFLDSDDMWLPTKLAKQLALFEVSGAPLVYSAYYKIPGDWSAEAADFTPTGRVVRAPLRLEYKHMLRQDRSEERRGGDEGR